MCWSFSPWRYSGGLRPPDRGHRDLARRPTREGAAHRRGLPPGRAVRTHHSRARPARRRRRAARDAVPPGRLLGRADPGDRRLGRTRPGQRGGVRRRLRRCADGDDGVDVATGPRPVGRGRRSVRRVRDVLRSVDARHSDDHHETGDAARRRAGVRADDAVERHNESVYFSFENVGDTAVFGIAFPTANPSIPVKGSLPQTFLDITAKQADRARSD